MSNDDGCRQQILDAAAAVILRQGYDKATRSDSQEAIHDNR